VTIASVGTLGSAADATAGVSSFTLTTATTAVSQYDEIIVVVAIDNTNTTDGTFNEVTSVTIDDPSDSFGPQGFAKVAEYTNGNGAAKAGITISVWKLRAPIPYALSSVITINHGTTPTDKCAIARVFSSTTPLIVSTGITNPVLNATDASTGFGSATISGLSSKEYLFVRGLAKAANTTTSITASTNFTGWGATVRSQNASTAVIARAEHRVVTATSSTSNPTLAVSGDTAGAFLAFEEAAADTLALLHTTDADIALPPSVVHTTDADVELPPNVTHTTDADVEPIPSIDHTTDGRLYTLTSPTIDHTTDGLTFTPGVIENSLSQDVEALLKIALAVGHQTDALAAGDLLVSHTTSARLNALTSHTLTQTINAFLDLGPHALHTANASILGAISRHHTTVGVAAVLQSLNYTIDSMVVYSFNVANTTNAFLYGFYQGRGPATFPRFGTQGKGEFKPPEPYIQDIDSVYYRNRRQLEVKYDWGKPVDIPMQNCCQSGLLAVRDPAPSPAAISENSVNKPEPVIVPESVPPPIAQPEPPPRKQTGYVAKKPPRKRRH
jgi:hypothetical protein